MVRGYVDSEERRGLETHDEGGPGLVLCMIGGINTVNGSKE